MLYLNYIQLSSRHRHFQAVYEGLCDERERLLSAAMPHGTRLDGCKVSGSGFSRMIEDSVIRVELSHIDRQIQEARSILDDWEFVKACALDDLRNSDDLHDKVFCYRYVDRRKAEWISSMIGLSESQVYRIIQKIQKNLDKALPPSLEKPGK